MRRVTYIHIELLLICTFALVRKDKYTLLAPLFHLMTDMPVKMLSYLSLHSDRRFHATLNIGMSRSLQNAIVSYCHSALFFSNRSSCMDRRF